MVVVKLSEVWVEFLEFFKFGWFHEADGRGEGGIRRPNVE